MDTSYGQIGLILMLLGSFLVGCLPRLVSQPRSNTDYLFSGNRPLLAWAGNAGSLFTMMLFVSALISAPYFYGTITWVVVAVVGVVGVLVATHVYRATGEYFRATDESGMPRRSTIAEYVFFKIGSATGWLAFVLWLVLALSTMVMEMAFIRFFLQKFCAGAVPSPDFYFWTLIAVCCLYTGIGGFGGDLRTDFLQMATILALLVGVVVTVLVNGALPQAVSIGWRQLGKPQWLTAISEGMLAIAFVLAGADWWLRNVGTLEDDRKIGRSLWWGYLALMLAILVPVGIGVWARHDGLTPGSGDFIMVAAFDILKAVFAAAALSPLMEMLVFASLAAISLTTLDTLMMTTGQLVYQRIDRSQRRPTTAPSRWVVNPRLLVASSGITTALVASLVDPTKVAVCIVLLGCIVTVLGLFAAFTALVPSGIRRFDGRTAVGLGLTLAMSIAAALLWRLDKSYMLVKGVPESTSAIMLPFIVLGCAAVGVGVVSATAWLVTRLRTVRPRRGRP